MPTEPRTTSARSEGSLDRQDADLLATVGRLVDEEHLLRNQAAHTPFDRATERRRLADLELQLDQCWDLLRQRRARRESGQDPEGARARPAGEVSGYRQ